MRLLPLKFGSLGAQGTREQHQERGTVEQGLKDFFSCTGKVGLC